MSVRDRNMTTGDVKSAATSYASPPSIMHELDPDFIGHPVDYGKRPIAIGVGHPIGEMATTFRQSRGIPVDWIVKGFMPPRLHPCCMQASRSGEQQARR